MDDIIITYLFITFFSSKSFKISNTPIPVFAPQLAIATAFLSQATVNQSIICKIIITHHRIVNIVNNNLTIGHILGLNFFTIFTESAGHQFYLVTSKVAGGDPS